jgi:hypothetical protein
MWLSMAPQEIGSAMIFGWGVDSADARFYVLGKRLPNDEEP